MTTLIVIQARMGSTRLPGKVLMKLGGHPVLEWVVRACSSVPNADAVIVATSELDADDEIDQWCENNHRHCWRGSESDVLERYIGAARVCHADVIVRITGDEPFVDPRVIAEVIELRKRTDADYASNCHPRTYPDGLDVEVFTRKALEAAHAEAKRAIDRDTVTYWIMRNQSRFPAATLINPTGDMSAERWVLDTDKDLEFCRAVVPYWPWAKGAPSMMDVLGILDRNPHLRDINPGVMNERFFEALAQEEIVPRSYERSQAQFTRAKQTIPLAAQTFSKSHLQFAQPSPLFLSHGQGALVYDVDGNEYVDLVSALLPNVLGYRDSEVDQAIRRQICSGISFSLATELEAQLAETLCRLIPCAEQVRFGKTGTDATTAAIRLARAYTKRDQVLICGGYHGWADWSTERNIGVPQPAQWRSTRVAFGYRGMAFDTMKYAAVIVEPDRDPEFLQWLRDYCDRTGAVLIFDEVITGFRYHLGGAQAHWGITPDLACFGKAMANGMPLSALVGKREIMKRMEPPDNIFYSGTFFGETLSLAASIATIAKMERENTIERLWHIGSDLTQQARTVIKEYGLEDVAFDLQGEAPFKRLWFKNDDFAALFRRLMIDSGTLIIGSHNVCAALGPNEIKRIIKSYEVTCATLAMAIDAGNVKELAGGSVAKGVR